ncbi:hypothetical protein [Streptomyces sp. NPDC002209]|uniref:hypothetical protein n=1 Tax=Streptomyces sp. NPDC002209 TaxID=3364638 RepID=UPI0036B2E8A7
MSERRPLSPETALAVHHPLTGRLASVRLKYRREALRLASTYWPKDLALAMRAALSIVEDLNYLLEADELVPQVRHCTEQLAEHLAQIDLLPSPQRQRRSEQAGANYLTDVEVLLESHAEQLLRDVHSAQQLLSGELAPLIDTAEVDDDCLLAYTIAQDLADDLEQAHGKAQALCLVVGAVEKVSSDFVGEDLSQANLDHVPLKGIRWDAATLWPEEWEALIRRASMPASGEQGVLIVATEPHDSVVSADA